MRRRLGAGGQPGIDEMGIGVPCQQAGLKNTIALFHTAGAPPNRGSTMRTNKGCIQNNNSALRKIVTVNRCSMINPAPDCFLDMD